MGYKMRKSMRLGPLRFNFTQNGFSSWSVKLGPWSWNSKTRKSTINTPGPGHWESGGKGK